MGKVANAAEAEALIRSMISYGGTYECGDNQVIHHCDISWNQSFAGRVQRRRGTLEGPARAFVSRRRLFRTTRSTAR